MTWPISALDSPSLATERLVSWATATAWSATMVASFAPFAISAMELDNAAAATETPSMPAVTPDATVEELTARVRVASAPVTICLLAAASRRDVDVNLEPTSIRGRVIERVIQMTAMSMPMPNSAVRAAARLRAANAAS